MTLPEALSMQQRFSSGDQKKARDFFASQENRNQLPLWFESADEKVRIMGTVLSALFIQICFTDRDVQPAAEHFELLSSHIDAKPELRGQEMGTILVHHHAMTRAFMAVEAIDDARLEEAAKTLLSQAIAIDSAAHLQAHFIFRSLMRWEPTVEATKEAAKKDLESLRKEH